MLKSASGLAPEELAEILDSQSSMTAYAGLPADTCILTFVGDNVWKWLGHDAADFIADADFWFDHVHPDEELGLDVVAAREVGGSRRSLPTSVGAYRGCLRGEGHERD